MKPEDRLLCPFDKKACIREKCAVWAGDREVCSLSMIPEMVHTVQQTGIPPVPRKERGASEGGQGKYRTLLFD